MNDERVCDNAEFVIARNRRLLVGRCDSRDVLDIVWENFRLARLVFEARAERDRWAEIMERLRETGFVETEPLLHHHQKHHAYSTDPKSTAENADARRAA